jgi:ketosteroid isomerase-like protein
MNDVASTPVPNPSEGEGVGGAGGMADLDRLAARLHRLAARIDLLASHEAIRQLAARYALAIDARDLDMLVGLFVPDVRVGPDDVGRDALKASFDASLRAIGTSVLNVGTHVIDLTEPDRATGIVYCKAEIQDGARWIHQAVAYEDHYRELDGTWYFVRRLHRLFYGAEVGTNPLQLAPANWPDHHDGWGTVPESWETWGRFWQYSGGPPHRPGDRQDLPDRPDGGPSSDSANTTP